MNRALYLTLVAALVGGCTWDEGLEINNMTGTVVLPEAAGNRTIIHTDGTSHDIVDDARLLGPVYLGLYPSVKDGLYAYPHPETGPVFEKGVPGDTYPYGGTTIGDIRYACFQDLACRVVSGRFVDFDDMVDWYSNELDDPITDAFGNEVTNGDYIRQICYDQLHYTDDEEIRITATTDRNEDGNLDAQDLDFIQRSDGKWEAEFTFWQQEYFDNAETGDGFSLWGWMDAPSGTTFRFATCDSEEGFRETEYNQDFFGGTQFEDLLNQPSSYISTGDYVATTGWVYSGPDDTPELEIDWLVEN